MHMYLPMINVTFNQSNTSTMAEKANIIQLMAANNNNNKGKKKLF